MYPIEATFFFVINWELETSKDFKTGKGNVDLAEKLAIRYSKIFLLAWHHTI